MRLLPPIILGAIAATIPGALCQSADLIIPKNIEAGAAFSIGCTDGCSGILYIVGPGQALKRDVQSASTIWFPAGALYNAGLYMVVLTSQSSSRIGALDVVPAARPSDLAFIAKPSRVPVAQHDGITGTAYVFDSYQNLITQPMPISFQLTSPFVPEQSRTVQTRDGAAWTQMDSATREGKAEFIANAGDVSRTRVIGEVPGDPCSLKVSAKASGNRIELSTDPVRDCSGNAVADGTIVTFTELYNGAKSSVDVPLKKDVSVISMPAYRGATISVASGVVLGNQIRWEQ